MLLSKNGEVTQLNEKPALLLSLLLHEADKIHHKSEILAKVWPNRVVTEQVIFQNISYLRARFGDDAIKTFSKKGYQWQLPFELVGEISESESCEEPSQSDVEQNALVDNHLKFCCDKIAPNKTRFNVNVKSILLFCLLGYLVGLLLWLLRDLPVQVDKETRVADESIRLLSVDDKGVIKTQLLQTAKPQNLFDSPYSNWSLHAASEADWLVATRDYSIKDKTAVRFHIQGAKRGWHHYIEADNKQDAEKKLRGLVDILTTTSYFNSEYTHTALAELTLLVANHPENTLLKDQLIKLYFQLNELDKASALVDQEINNSHSLFRTGLLLLLKTRITSWNKNHLASKQSVEKALQIFTELQLSQLKSLTLIQLAWVHLVDLDFRQGMHALNSAANEARKAKEPVQELTARLNQAFMAYKADQIELSYTQLDLAKALISLHQLSSEHQIAVLNNAAWLAGTAADQLAQHQQILAMPFSPQYEKDFYIAAKFVRDYYIEHNQLQQALSSIKPWQRDSFQSLSQAHIAFAKGDWHQGLTFAKTSYQQAHVIHHKIDALDAALLILLQQFHQGGAIENDEYQVFIKQNATNRWLDKNRLRLAQLDI